MKENLPAKILSRADERRLLGRFATAGEFGEQAWPNKQKEAKQVSVEEGSLLDQMLEDAKVRPDDEAYGTTALGLKQLLREMLAPDKKGARVDKKAVDRMIAEIDEQLSKQVNEVLHHPDVQKLESSWRGLKYLVDQVDFRENTKVEFINVSKDDLAADFEDTPEIPKSGLYQKVYSREYGVFGGSPVGLICRQLRLRSRPGRRRALAQLRSGVRHGPRAVCHERVAQVLWLR